MRAAEDAICRIAQDCGLTVIHHPGKPYFLRSWEGIETGPFTAPQARSWLAGYSVGMKAHEPDCQCGRFGCAYRERRLRDGKSPG